jgi:hypothetical protein
VKRKPAIAYDAAGRLDADVYCVCCGHNLRALPPSGRCGECATPVEWSLRGGEMAAADERWTGRVLGSVQSLLLLGPWVWLPLSWPLIGLAFWGLLAKNPGSPGRRRYLDYLFRAAGVALLLAGLGAIICELVLPFTIPRPSGTGMVAFMVLVTLLTLVLFAPLVGLALHRMAVGARLEIPRRRSALAVALWFLSAAGLAGSGAAVAERYDELGALLGVLSIGALIASLIALCGALSAAWGALSRVDIYVRTERDRPRPWPRQVRVPTAPRVPGSSIASGDPTIGRPTSA